MKPLLIKTHDVHGSDYEHPAFGMISYGRVSGGSISLAGSELKHQHHIRLSIDTATQHRNLHEDRFYGGNRIVEICMSEQQWATFVSSPNTSGVPCTFRYRPDPGAGLLACPVIEDTNKHELAKSELGEYGNEMAAALREEISNLQTMLKNPTIKKGELAELVERLSHVSMGITSNMPFHIEQHAELMEKNVAAAKSDIEGYVTDTIYRLGLDKLKEIAPQLEYAPQPVEVKE